MRVKDKVIVITGAAHGIGRETAHVLAREGAKVMVIDRDGQAAARVADEIGDQAIACEVDITDRSQVDRAVEKAVEHWGRIDVLINNAGITHDGTLAKMTEDQFDRVIDVNLKGVFHCTQAVLPHMVSQGKGKILCTASVVALYGNFGQTNYVASKAGIIGMTKTWAKELARKGITANAVAPGFIATEMTAAMPEKVLSMMKDKTPVGRLGSPRDIANAYLFLASDDADFINGQVLGVDGGLIV